MTRRTTLWFVGVLLGVVAALGVPAAAGAAVTQPAQPTTGPGSSATPHAAVRTISGGTGNDAWFLFLPDAPQPTSAPLSVVTHGYFEFSGSDMNGAIARHTALTGDVVIYTRWQTSIASPCPGPFSIGPCIDSEVNGIKGALAYLRAHPELPQPDLGRTSYFGFSFGGIITANITSRWQDLGLPKPRAIFLDDPHDGGYAGNGEPALNASLAGIPSDTKIVCHSGVEGVIGEAGKAGSSCNAVFPRLGHVPAANKSLVSTGPDTHGSPALSSKHGVCAGASADFVVDAYDHGFCWRSWDALRSCALTATDCRYALGDTPENRYIGTWSDGTPIVGVKVQTSGPIDPKVVPARQAAPTAGAPPATADRAPTGRVTTLRDRGRRPQQLRGTASDDRRVTSVAVAVVRRSGSRCAALTRRGTFGRAVRCTTPTASLKAKGTTRWSVVLPGRLPAGSYRVTVRVTDDAGHVTTTPARTVRAR